MSCWRLRPGTGARSMLPQGPVMSKRVGERERERKREGGRGRESEREGGRETDRKRKGSVRETAKDGKKKEKEREEEKVR